MPRKSNSDPNSNKKRRKHQTWFTTDSDTSPTTRDLSHTPSQLSNSGMSCSNVPAVSTPQNITRHIQSDQQPSLHMNYSDSNSLQISMSESTVTVPVQWMQEITVQLASIHKKVSEIDNVKSLLNHITIKMNLIDNYITNLKHCVYTLETSAEIINNTMESIKSNQVLANSQMKSFTAEMSTKVRQSKIEKQSDTLQSEIIDLQCCSMRNNLIFYGIPASDEFEDYSNKILRFCEN